MWHDTYACRRLERLAGPPAPTPAPGTGPEPAPPDAVPDIILAILNKTKFYLLTQLKPQQLTSGYQFSVRLYII
jgi:hypothetical protein